MKLISSRQTWFLKKMFPVLYFGTLVVVAIAVFADRHPKPGSRAIVWSVLGPVALLGAFLYRWLIAPLADEVWDAGSELIVKKGGEEAHVLLAQIVNISYERFTNPPLMTLTLREATALGDRIVFAPPVRFLRFARNPLVDDLILRVDATRR